MKNITTYGVTALIAVLVVLAHGAFFPSSTTVVKEQIGSLAGPDIPSPYLRWGNVAVYKGAMNMTAATTTICAIQAPAATSTLLTSQMRFDVSSTSASVITIAKATTAFATTTIIGTAYSIAANAQAFIQASTSPTGPALVFAPNTYLVVGIQGGIGTFSPTGTCQASWEVST